MGEAESPAQKVAEHDVIQIAPDERVPGYFHGKLAIVDEVWDWGIQAYVSTFKGDTYIRLVWGTFALVGPAPFIRGELEDKKREKQ